MPNVNSKSNENAQCFLTRAQMGKSRCLVRPSCQVILLNHYHHQMHYHLQTSWPPLGLGQAVAGNCERQC